MELELNNDLVAFAGDWHGDANHAWWCLRRCEELGIGLLIQLGDYGHWPHASPYYQNDVDRAIEDQGVQVLWVAGNHENWDSLDELPREEDGTCKVGLSTYLPRGTFFKIGGRQFFASGGAWSVDWEQRLRRESRGEVKQYWKQETLTEGFVQTIPRRHVDIVVSHECPTGATISYKDEIAISTAQRALSAEICEKLTPDFWFSGHHHTRASFPYKNTRVNVLDMNYNKKKDSIAFFDLDTMSMMG